MNSPACRVKQQYTNHSKSRYPDEAISGSGSVGLSDEGELLTNLTLISGSYCAASEPQCLFYKPHTLSSRHFKFFFQQFV